MWDKCDLRFILMNYDDENMVLQYSFDMKKTWNNYDTSKSRVNSLLALSRMVGIEWRYRYK